MEERDLQNSTSINKIAKKVPQTIRQENDKQKEVENFESKELETEVGDSEVKQHKSTLTENLFICLTETKTHPRHMNLRILRCTVHLFTFDLLCM